MNPMRALESISSLSSISSTNVGQSRNSSPADGFMNVLREKFDEVDRMGQEVGILAEKAALGNAGVSIHEAEIASAQADLHMRLLMQTRNKVLEAYKDIMSMQV